MDSDQACPKCKTTLYRNPNMKLMVNVCGHNLCESCVELLFAKGSGSCPECGIPLRRTNFRLQLFEDASIDREVDIRRRVLRDFNRSEDEFQSLNAYNDYLEMIEDIIFNLTHNVDIEETQSRIEQYRETNRDDINRNRLKTSKESLELSALLTEEERRRELRTKQIEEELKLEKKLKTEQKEKLIDDLMFSDADASAIVNQHKEQSAKEADIQQVNLPKFEHTSNNVVVNEEVSHVNVEGVPFFYEESKYDFNGPRVVQSLADVEVLHYRNFIPQTSPAEMAAGHDSAVNALRALKEAFAGLYYKP